MMAFLDRKEPTLDLGEDIPETAEDQRIFRAPRRAPTGDLTRNIRKIQSRDELDRIRRKLDLSTATFEAVSVELLSGGGPLLDDGNIAAAMHSLFDFEPVGAMTPHPVILVGGSQDARMRAALALSQRIERAGRRIALYSFRNGDIAGAQATYRGGIDILHIGTIEGCIDAVRVSEPAELAIVEACCLDDAERMTTSLPMLTLSLNAEAIYVDDGETPIPDAAHLGGVERIILSGRQRAERFGTVLDAAYRYGWAFAGQCSVHGVWHPVTPGMLADRFALAVR